VSIARAANRPVAGIVTAGRPDVDPELVELDGLLALFLVEEVGRLLADDADDRPLLRQDADPLADQDGGRPAADAVEPEITLVVDVGHGEADLVDVPHDGDRPLAGGVHRRVARAERVGLDGGESGRVVPPDPGWRTLVTRRPGGVEEAQEELAGLLAHGGER
jgi:hypothetical protein